jgi:signal transduction histidine kinase
MSLRWRLTLWSTLILAVVIALFSTVAYFSANTFTYQLIDGNLKRQTDANLLYIAKYNLLETEQGTAGQFGFVAFTLFDREGQPYRGNDYMGVPLNESLFMKALGGEPVAATEVLPDGTRARVYLAPVRIHNEIVYVMRAATPLDIPDEYLSQLKAILIVSSVVLLVIGAVGSHLLAGRALQAVNSITLKARNIETSRDLSQRIPEPGTDDEIGNLVRTFNQMLARLEAAFEAQRRFVADSSHELRTPLTVIKGNLHLLRRTKDPREAVEILDVMEAETSRLNRMVNDLLYMAQVQAGHGIKPVMRPVELDSLLLDVHALARSMAALKEQKVVLAHEEIATTQGDRDQLQHLLLNLIDNAVKYTPEGGTISIGLWSDGAWARVDVSDNGPGIPQEELPLLFERFYRTGEARQKERSGSGLGLAIVRSIVEAHEGRIEVFSSIGEGSTFRVWLPVVSARQHIRGAPRLGVPLQAYNGEVEPEVGRDRNNGEESVRSEHDPVREHPG